MQGLDPAVHHLGKPGHRINAHDVHTGVGEPAGGPAGADDLDPRLRQRPREIHDAGLVRNADQSRFDFHVHLNSF